MDNGICETHPGRHAPQPDCVQWDGSEETRLGLLAAAESEIASLKGSLASANDKAMMRGRAAHEAQAALAEARGALREGVICLRKSAEHIQDLESSASQDDWGKIKRLRNRMREQADQLDAALARAGEQDVVMVPSLPVDDAADARIADLRSRQPPETKRPIAGEPASSGQEVVGGSRRFGKTEALKQAALEAVARNPDAVIAWAGPRAGPDQPWHAPAAPPPGEQGKGGGEGLPSMGYLSTLADMETVIVRAVGIFERAARGLVLPGQPIDQRRLSGDCESALRQLRPMLLTVRAFLDANPPAQPAERPASGGEEKASSRVDFQCDTCGHRHVGRLGGICIGCPCERIVPAPAPGAGEQEEGT